MKKIIEKADVLIEALPYIKNFRNKIFVLKYGGSAMMDRERGKTILQDIVFMNYVGIKVIVVHGGGYFINQSLKKQGKQPKFVNGLRVTDKNAIETVISTLKVLNKQIVEEIGQFGGESVGVNGEEVFRVNPHTAGIGYVGEVESVDTQRINQFLEERKIPVISPLGKNGQKIYNVNADQTAAEISLEIKAEKLVLLTDVIGILADKEKDDSLVSTLNIKEVGNLIDREIIAGGMVPKVNAAVKALRQGVNKVHIIDGRIKHSLLLEIFTNQGIG
ncbi:MAG: acetylglutamate kinase, partial [Candidatus Omnitrophica bacterium]|nr:acetylglutamate kinase [Candidatus Omnitrophota bacterium]